MDLRRLAAGRLRSILAVCMLGATAPAAAGQYFFCYVNDYSGERGRYYTPVYETPVDEVDERQTGFAFSESTRELQQQDYPGDGGARTGCYSGSNRAYILEQHGNFPTNYPGARQVEWSDPPIPAAAVEDGGHSGAITIEPAPAPGPTPEQIAARLAAERALAADNAKRRAAAMRATEALRANERELIERARRRGRMQ